MILDCIEVNGYLVLVDKQETIKDFKYLIAKDKSCIFEFVKETKAGYSGKLLVYKDNIVEGAFTFEQLKDFYKIIFAEEELKLDIPILPNIKQWEVEQLAEKHVQKVSKYCSDEQQEGNCFDSFIEGYNANKNEFSLDDLKSAIGAGLSIGYGNTFDIDDREKTIKNVLNYFKKIPKQIVMETDGKHYFETNVENRINLKNGIYYKPKLINKNNKTFGIIKEIIYENYQ